jgi:co-chaperonin GroES (HSP10)
VLAVGEKVWLKTGTIVLVSEITAEEFRFNGKFYWLCRLEDVRGIVNPDLCDGWTEDTTEDVPDEENS